MGACVGDGVRIHQLSALDAIASLKTTTAGLSRAEVERRLGEYGRNAVEEVARSPLWLRLVREFITFFSLILWIAAALAFFAAWSDPGDRAARRDVVMRRSACHLLGYATNRVLPRASSAWSRLDSAQS